MITPAGIALCLSLGIANCNALDLLAGIHDRELTPLHLCINHRSDAPECSTCPAVVRDMFYGYKYAYAVYCEGFKGS